MGTFSKSFASLGGVIAGDADVIEFIQHKARSLIFSASMPPSAVATVLACLDIIEENPHYVDRLHVVANTVRDGLQRIGFDTGVSCTQIVPVMIGDEMDTIAAWQTFYNCGVYVNPVLPPAVPPNKGLLRTSYMATHTDEHVTQILNAFERVAEQMHAQKSAA
jgi:7-keto-8-aminopelargonate synthetase-like enzyme